MPPCEIFPLSHFRINDFDDPTIRVAGGVDLVAIDHLPSMVPYESSKEFVDAMLPHLLAFDGTPVWKRALDLFEEKVRTVVGE